MIILDALITQWKAVANVCNKSWINVCEHTVPARDCFYFLILHLFSVWSSTATTNHCFVKESMREKSLSWVYKCEWGTATGGSVCSVQSACTVVWTVLCVSSISTCAGWSHEGRKHSVSSFAGGEVVFSIQLSRLIVMEFRRFFHCLTGDLGKDEMEKTTVHGEKVSTGGMAQR